MNTPKRRSSDTPGYDLQDANALLRTVIDENPNIILMKDWDGKFLLGNRALAQLYGTTPDQLVGKDDGAFNPNTEQVAFYLQNVREVMSQDQTQVVMEESTDTTGETLYYQSIKIPLTTPEGKKQILVIANDVSELKRVQLKLEASERRLNYVLDATGEGIWDWDIRTGIVTHNRRWCQITGLDEAYLQHPLDEFAALLHADDKAKVMQKLEDCLAGKAHYQSEHRMQIKGQQEVWVLDRGDVVERDADGHPLRMVGSFVDISERKAGEVLLSEHSAQLDAIFALSPDGFVAFDHLHVVKYVSPAFTNLTGLSSDQVIGLDERAFSKKLADLCAPEARFQGLAALRGAAHAGMDHEPHQVFELQQAPGESATGPRVLKVSLRESQEQSIAQILALRDISHETAVDRMKSEFLSTAAHELRTPMSGIYGFAEVLLTEQLSEPERKEFLEIIYRQSKLMAAILNELLDLARIEALQGKDFVFESVPVQALIDDVVRGLKLPDDRAAPTIDLPAEPVFLWADQKKAQMALLNVLSNAYKYSAPGESVHIAVENLKGQVAVRITDQGVGMTPDQAGRVGERFYRADTSGKVSGTGLGMSIVKEIMALHYGHMALGSVPGQGTTVSLIFPAGNMVG